MGLFERIKQKKQLKLQREELRKKRMQAEQQVPLQVEPQEETVVSQEEASSVFEATPEEVVAAPERPAPAFCISARADEAFSSFDGFEDLLHKNTDTIIMPTYDAPKGPSISSVKPDNYVAPQRPSAVTPVQESLAEAFPKETSFVESAPYKHEEESPIVTPVQAEKHEDLYAPIVIETTDHLRDLEPHQTTQEEHPTADYSAYLPPPITLLNPPERGYEDARDQQLLQEQGIELIEAFKSFKIQIELCEIQPGPRITRFCVLPPPGVKISALVNLSSDIARALAVTSVLISTVPNQSYLGVEVPKKHPTIVSLRELIDTPEYRNSKSPLKIPLGAAVSGTPVYGDISKMPHLLIAGATGMGKSVFMNSLLVSILYKARPDEVKLILIDPKRVELSVYSGIPHLLIPTVTDPQKAAGALIWAVGEMERRYFLMESTQTRTMESYNECVRSQHTGGEILPRILIVIDELNDLMMQVKDAVEPAIMRITQKARAAGIHLIIGTQRPSVDVITGVIKGNLPSRIAFHCSSGQDSRVVLDAYGAEKLLNNGDMLAIISGAEPLRVQSAFVKDDEVERVTNFLRSNSRTCVYDDYINAQIEQEMNKYQQEKTKGKGQVGEPDDEDMDVDGSVFEDFKFMQACKICFEQQKISTSLLQRMIKIGYGKAAGYIDTMQSLGIVGPPDGAKARKVLMTYDEFLELVAREQSHAD